MNKMHILQLNLTPRNLQAQELLQLKFIAVGSPPFLTVNYSLGEVHGVNISYDTRVNLVCLLLLLFVWNYHVSLCKPIKPY